MHRKEKRRVTTKTQRENEMKKNRRKVSYKSSIQNLDASRQASLSILLLTAIPSLVSFLAGYQVAGESGSAAYAGLLGLITITLIIAGYRILKKYPDNIVRIRHYVSKAVKGYLPEHMALLRTNENDDLLYIEQCFNSMISEMKNRQNLSVMIEHQRTMVESVGILVDKISDPLDNVRRNLMHLDLIAPMEEEHSDIVRSLKEIERIEKSLQKLMNSREMKAVQDNQEPPLSTSLAESAETESESYQPDDCTVPVRGKVHIAEAA